MEVGWVAIHCPSKVGLEQAGWLPLKQIHNWCPRTLSFCGPIERILETSTRYPSPSPRPAGQFQGLVIGIMSVLVGVPVLLLLTWVLAAFCSTGVSGKAHPNPAPTPAPAPAPPKSKPQALQIVLLAIVHPKCLLPTLLPPTFLRAPDCPETL